MMDRYFVVTHLICEVEIASAPAHRYAIGYPAQPYLFTDSAGINISHQEFIEMKWTDYLGREVAAPPAGCKTKVAYYRPKMTKPTMPENK
jgi:hypothetical protein